MALRTARRAGFTLVELMVALLAGSFAVVGAYYLSGVSSRAYQDQMRVNETQQSLRSAMEQLRRDIGRAGYLAVPNTSLVLNCSDTPGAAVPDLTPRNFGALRITHNGSVTANALVGQLLRQTGAEANQTRADTLELWGNYATSDAYLIDNTQTDSQTIVLDTSRESFRRSFVDPATGTVNATLFQTVFGEGRMLRVEYRNKYFFRDIQTSDATTNAARPTITLASALPTPCFTQADFVAVSPVMRVRYQMEPDNVADLARVNNVRQAAAQAASTRLPGTRRTLLVRREITDSTGDVVDNTSRIILDYAVEFAVDGIVNTAGATATPAWQYVTGSAVTAQSTNSPETFRSLLVTLSSRSTDADPNLRRLERARFGGTAVPDSPLLTFTIYDPTYPNLLLRSRVRTMRSEVFLQNM